MARYCWIGWIALLLVVSVERGWAQAPSEPTWGAYRDTIDAFKPPPYRLRPFVLPGSERLFLNGTRLDTTMYRIDYRHGRVWLPDRRLRTDAQLVAIYRTYPFRFASVYRQRHFMDSTVVSPNGPRVLETPDSARNADSAGPLAGFQLERSGSISRGVIAGSNRDVNIESGLRMQLAGAIAEEVTVQAVLTDANTPIQPEGTTQRLNNFDRVFMQIDAPPGTARLGDIQVDYDGSTFAPFSRKLQGASVASSSFGRSVPGLSQGRVRAVGATTRGRFRSQDLTPIDGVQGPYRLEGADGERFIVVIAGSERVFLDGERLTRGETNDYVIDYAQAEITFTANRLITADRRITVEFEYTTSGFNRTFVGADTQLGFGGRVGGAPRIELGATFLREADDRTFSDAFDLSPEDSLLLEQAGDAGVARSGAEPVSFDPEAPYVQYRRELRPTPDGTIDTVFVALDAAPADTTTVYRVRFSRVGTGAGRYERVGRSVNGIVYEYRGPGQGDYAPVRRLPQPIQQRIMDLRGRVRPLPHVEFSGEWAQSLNDENRFSSLDAADDQGQAYEAALRLDAVPLEGARWSLGTLTGALRRRVTGEHFTAFNRTRPVEFGRRWNLAARGFDASAAPSRGDETIDEASLHWAFAPSSYLAGGVGRIARGRAFDAQREEVAVRVGEAGWPTLRYDAERITSTDARNGIDGTWWRQRGTLRQSLAAWTPRIGVEHEVRRQRVSGTDSLARASFAFVEVRPGVEYQAGALTAGAEVEYRTARNEGGGRLREASRAWTVQSDLTYRPNSSYNTQARLGVRARRFTNYFRLKEQQQDRESIILQWKGTARPFDRAVEVEAFYDALTERTPTQQEIYVRTGPELGQYVWTDANDDGIIQLDEFVPETTPNEGTYVQRFVPSDSLTPVVNLQARLRLRTDPGRHWRNASTWWKQALAVATTETTLEVREKNRSSDLGALYRLNQDVFREEGRTLDGQMRIGQDVFLFRRAAAFGLDVSFDQLRGLSERAAGLRTRFRSAWTATGRVRFGPSWSSELTGAHRIDRSTSRAFASRSFDIESVELRPTVTYRPGRSVRVTSAPSWARKRDAIGPRTAHVLKVPIEVRWGRASRFELTGRLEVADIRLDGAATGLARFELTDGRGAGTSYLWRLGGQYRFSDRLRATFSYDGRAPADAPTINSVRMQMSASF